MYGAHMRRRSRAVDSVCWLCRSWLHQLSIRKNLSRPVLDSLSLGYQELALSTLTRLEQKHPEFQPKTCNRDTPWRKSIVFARHGLKRTAGYQNASWVGNTDPKGDARGPQVKRLISLSSERRTKCVSEQVRVAFKNLIRPAKAQSLLAPATRNSWSSSLDCSRAPSYVSVTISRQRVYSTTTVGKQR